MQKYKNLGLAIVIIVIGYNVYDYLKVKKNIRQDGIEECSKKFRDTNPGVDKKIADKYCECALGNLGENIKTRMLERKQFLKKNSQ